MQTKKSKCVTGTLKSSAKYCYEFIQDYASYNEPYIVGFNTERQKLINIAFGNTTKWSVYSLYLMMSKSYQNDLAVYC